MAADDGSGGGGLEGLNGHAPQRPPADVRLYQRRRAAGATTPPAPTTAESESGEMGTVDDALTGWLNRLESKLDDVIQNVLPRVAALETSVEALRAAPARFRAWSSWSVSLLAAGLGCFGCLGTLAGVGSFLLGVASFVVLLLR